MKVRRSPASFPRGLGTAMGAKAEHSESGTALLARGKDLISCFHYLRSEKEYPGELGCHTGDCQHLWVDNGRKDKW